MSFSTSYALLKNQTIAELRAERARLLEQDAYDFEDQESISENIQAINYELRVERNVSVVA